MVSDHWSPQRHRHSLSMWHSVIHLLWLIGNGHCFSLYGPTDQQSFDLLYHSPFIGYLHNKPFYLPQSPVDYFMGSEKSVKSLNYQHNIWAPEPATPQTVIVDATVMPLTIYFRSSSSTVKVLQEHVEKEASVQYSKTEEKPHRVFHEIHKPVIQEVREIIKPHRKVVQEMYPVIEQVNNIINQVDSPEDSSLVPPYQYGLEIKFPKSNTNGFKLNNYSISTPESVPNLGIFAFKQQKMSYGNEVDKFENISAYDRLEPQKEQANLSTTTENPFTITSIKTTFPRSNQLKTIKKLNHSTIKTRRVKLKQTIEEIKRQKRKIRLGFFGIYDINLIPYYYDKFSASFKL